MVYYYHTILTVTDYLVNLFAYMMCRVLGQRAIHQLLGRLLIAMPFVLVAESGNSSTIADVKSALRDLQSRFTYRLEPEGRDDWRILSNEGSVEGDCEDFALTLRAIIGGQIYIVQESVRSRPHALLCGVDWCVDNIQPTIFDVDIRNHRYVIQISDEEIELRLRNSGNPD